VKLWIWKLQQKVSGGKKLGKMLDGILVCILLFYIAYTFTYIKVLQSNKLFTPKIKLTHLILIWAIPFLWILLLKTLANSAPGSHEVDKKQDSDPFFDVYQSGE
jgi:hypothetical protein